MSSLTCLKCNGIYASSQSLWNHKQRCKATTSNTKNNYHQGENDLQLSRFADIIINKMPDADNNNMIQQSKSTSIGNGEEHLVKTADKILSVHEAAKKMKIIPYSDESEEDESVVGDEHEDSDFENKDIVEGRGNEIEMESDEEDDYESKKQLKPIQLEARLYTSGNKMKVFELDLDVNRALSNIDLLEYVKLLKVPNFRDVYHVDELPKKVNDVECGIVNLSPHEQLGTHWICYVKINKIRMYFDSFGRKTPLEIQKYLKTAEEFRNNEPVIQSSTNIVQRVNTKICGHLCLFVLTSLMRERIFSFHQVMDQLNYAFTEYYY